MSKGRNAAKIALHIGIREQKVGEKKEGGLRGGAEIKVRLSSPLTIKKLKAKIKGGGAPCAWGKLMNQRKKRKKTDVKRGEHSE